MVVGYVVLYSREKAISGGPEIPLHENAKVANANVFNGITQLRSEVIEKEKN